VDVTVNASEIEAKFKQARKQVVEASGIVWADAAKRITRDDDHIDTGLYINSIGYLTNFPAQNKNDRTAQATEGDVLYELDESQSGRTTLSLGSNVEYAEELEKRYNIFGRALDASQDRIQVVSTEQVKKVFG
jgi:hypothetical protein